MLPEVVQFGPFPISRPKMRGLIQTEPMSDTIVPFLLFSSETISWWLKQLQIGWTKSLTNTASMRWKQHYSSCWLPSRNEAGGTRPEKTVENNVRLRVAQRTLLQPSWLSKLIFLQLQHEFFIGRPFFNIVLHVWQASLRPAQLQLPISCQPWSLKWWFIEIDIKRHSMGQATLLQGAKLVQLLLFQQVPTPQWRCGVPNCKTLKESRGTVMFADIRRLRPNERIHLPTSFPDGLRPNWLKPVFSMQIFHVFMEWSDGDPLKPHPCWSKSTRAVQELEIASKLQVVTYP